MMKTPLVLVPSVLNGTFFFFVHRVTNQLGIITAKVSVERIEKFLLGRELDPDAVVHEFDARERIVVNDATLTWNIASLHPTVDMCVPSLVA
jgi:hypothetical protein